MLKIRLFRALEAFGRFVLATERGKYSEAVEPRRRLAELGFHVSLGRAPCANLATAFQGDGNRAKSAKEPPFSGPNAQPSGFDGPKTMEDESDSALELTASVGDSSNQQKSEARVATNALAPRSSVPRDPAKVSRGALGHPSYE